MKRRSSNTLRLLFTGCLSMGVCAPIAYAQTNVSLNLQLYAGISVTGTVGRVYQLQYTTDVSETSGWRSLTHFKLRWNPHEYVDKTSPATELRFYRAVELEVPRDVIPLANMVFVPAGEFIIGSPPEEPARLRNEGPQTEVTISRGFWMGIHEVTQAEYVNLIGVNPSRFRNWTPSEDGGTGGVVTEELRHPVEQVSWSDATNYCGRLTEQERAAGRVPEGYMYRLPTEAEWEYACRAGTRTPFHFGSSLRSEMANFKGTGEYPPCSDSSSPYVCDNPAGTYLGRTTEVGSYAPNEWGLYDMHGNVREFCQDWLGDYPGGAVTDPQGVPVEGHGLRGGSWGDTGRDARSAARNRWSDAANFVGFRVVLAPVRP